MGSGYECVGLHDNGDVKVVQHLSLISTGAGIYLEDSGTMACH